MFELSLSEVVLLSAAGIFTGIINGVVGGGSLISYLALVALGVPPVQAAMTNTIGVLSGNPAALLPRIKKGDVDIRSWYPLALITLLGALLGGVFLIVLPEQFFEALVPLLLFIASVAMFLPLKSVMQSPKLLKSGLFVGGLYNGYFGPGQGIITLALLYRWSVFRAPEIVVVKNFIITASNIALSILFALSLKVLWAIVPILLISVAVGGYVGGRVAMRVNANSLRIFVAITGVVSACYFLLRY